MSSSTNNPITRSQTTLSLRSAPVIHPDYTYWAEYWGIIRDCELGEVEIKRKRETYLPKLVSQTEKEYSAYLQRAVFFNMTSKTLNALYGTVFQRAPKVAGLPEKIRQKTTNITKEGTSLHLMAKTAVKEVLALGRYGLLVDANPDGAGSPYVACYTAENILDWETTEINGKWQLSRVVLREIFYDRTSTSFAPTRYKSRYRVLMLIETEDEVVYEQHIYENRESIGLPDVEAVPDRIIVPEVRGEVLDYIPFIVIGPFTNHPDVQKPPMLDIVTLNISHYHSYAELEQGRFFTGNPTYWVQNADGDASAEYFVGPNNVWQLGANEQAGILEFNGQGLHSLESALKDKEAQISAIGGRLMPGTSRGAAESDNSLAMKERNEQTLLLNIADTVDEALTITLRWWADWNNIPATTITKIFFEINRDYIVKDVGAREFRAIHQMYSEGLLPVDALYEYLRKGDVIPEWMGLEEYTTLLNEAKQFPNMVDVLARMNGYPDAATFHKVRLEEMKLAAPVSTATPITAGANDPDSLRVPRQVTDISLLENQAATGTTK